MEGVRSETRDDHASYKMWGVRLPKEETFVVLECTSRGKDKLFHLDGLTLLLSAGRNGRRFDCVIA